MLAEDPQVAGLRPRFPGRRLERSVEVERLGTVALLRRIEAPQERPDLILAEARQADVDVRRLAEVGQESGEEGLVERATDPIEGESEDLGLGLGHVEEDCRDRRHPEPARADEALVASDDDPGGSPGDDRFDEAESPDAPGEGVEFVGADLAGVRRIGPEPIDRDEFDLR